MANDPIPPLHQFQYSLRNQDAIEQLRSGTEGFKSSFHPSCLMESDNLDHFYQGLTHPCWEFECFPDNNFVDRIAFPSRQILRQLTQEIQRFLLVTH